MHTHFSAVILHLPPFMMEDLDSCLFIVGVEVSCWQDQLRQAVTNCSIFSFKVLSLKYIFFLGILILHINLIFPFDSFQISILYN